MIKMKEYYINFQGFCRLKANSETEAQEKFYDNFYGVKELRENATVEVFDIIGEVKEE